VAAAVLLGAAGATWFALEAEANAAQAQANAAWAGREAEEARRKAVAEAQAKAAAEREKEEARRQLDRARRHLFRAQLIRVAAVMERDPGTGFQLLHDYNACPIDLRDFAWGWYERQCRRQPQRPALKGHNNRILSV